jgi:antitoxin HicB
MKSRQHAKTFDHSGSSFASFLDEEGIRDEVESMAVKRVLAWHLESAMRQRQKTKRAMARELRTSRSQLDRLLDPRNVSVSLHTITRAANVLGKRIVIRIADAKPVKPGRSSRSWERSVYAARRG